MIHMLQKMMMTPDGWMTTVPKAQPLLKYGQLKTIQQSQCLWVLSTTYSSESSSLLFTLSFFLCHQLCIGHLLLLQTACGRGITLLSLQSTLNRLVLLASASSLTLRFAPLSLLQLHLTMSQLRLLTNHSLLTATSALNVEWCMYVCTVICLETHKYKYTDNIKQWGWTTRQCTHSCPY